MALGKIDSARRPAFGIIGTGEIVRMIRPTLLRDDSLRVAAIAGSKPGAAAQLAREFGGITACADYRELLQLDLDAVFIATPPHIHCEIIEAALAAGKHIVCEKPLVMNLEELRAVEAAHCRHPHLKLASSSSRFHACPPVRKARELIARGRLGKILTVRLNISSEYPRAVASQPAWRRQRATSGGGIAMDWAVYDLDWLRYLLGDLFVPKAVMGSINFWQDEGTKLETSYLAHILCERGLTISLERRPEHGPQFQRAEIRGTDGGLDLPFMPGGGPPGLVWYHRIDNATLQEEALAEKMNDWDSILAYPVIDLARALAENREVASPLEVQPGIYGVIAALYQSAQTGESVAVTRKPKK
ncbi:Gfo/Idh/MocA family oxidoreductase [Opitutus sp. GAS368]|uniref:Gfo/Idh/MocA family protein n=1 Tax=Opitutus sp. GAS368 TaxID=1882749 RepID=UPI00087A0132|nr:Gfo/Idh/MocA family oxidoreductase [Opitutus sp. GAS368]SDS18259.1 Predicted dehydrogenase [Opitutus sp. GAS368]